jgi:hypothetical protein
MHGVLRFSAYSRLQQTRFSFLVVRSDSAQGKGALRTVTSHGTVMTCFGSRSSLMRT